MRIYKNLLPRVMSDKIKYTQTNNSEKLYLELNKSINPNIASGKTVMNVIVSTVLSALTEPIFRLKNIYANCPPSSDITGRMLNNPTDIFEAANGKT